MKERDPILIELCKRFKRKNIAAWAGVAGPTVSQWRQVPATRVLRLAEKTGFAPHVIRPDVFPTPAEPAE